MSDSLKPLLQALDAAAAPVPFFLRDDDGGWDDAALFALLDICDGASVPIDLAMIPQATSIALAAALIRRAAGGTIGLHQHGFAHGNHESEGRKCEFGASRNLQAQRLDLFSGRERLRELFGGRLDDIFTPPWNRCSEGTPRLLASLGFAALSRSRGAPAQQALPELPVDVDWCKQRRISATQGDDGMAFIAQQLATRVAAGGPVGLMLHHAAMGADDRQLLQGLLRATRSHACVRWQPMRELLAVHA